MKTCSKCGALKDETAFALRGDKNVGMLRSACRECCGKRQWPAGSERKAAIMRDWRQRNSLALAEYRREKSMERSSYAHTRRAAARSAGGRHTASEIVEIFNRQGGVCEICSADISSGFHKDHRIPLCRGGTNDASNIDLLCESCNCKKGRKTKDEFLEILAKA